MALAAYAFGILIWQSCGFPTGYYDQCQNTAAHNQNDNCTPYNAYLVAFGKIGETAADNRFNAALTLLFAFVTAGATFYIAKFTKTLYGVSRDQLMHNRRVERAYVKMSHSPPGVRFSRGGCDIELEIKNFGRTPTYITKIVFDLKILTDDQTLPLPPRYEGMHSINFRTFLVADDGAFTQAEFDFTLADANALPAGAEVCIFGYVDYVDAFGERHRGGYARMYQRHFSPDNNLVFGTIHEGYNYDRVRLPGEGDDWADNN